jgi:hypothetical protein
MTRAPLAVTAAFALLSAMHLIHLQLTGNFHEVVPGELYRSAQLSAGDLVTYAREKGHSVRSQSPWCGSGCALVSLVATILGPVKSPRWAIVRSRHFAGGRKTKAAPTGG